MRPARPAPCRGGGAARARHHGGPRAGAGSGQEPDPALDPDPGASPDTGAEAETDSEAEAPAEALAVAPALADAPPAAGCPGAVPGEIVAGVITVTCGADDGPGTLREAVALGDASATPVAIQIDPAVPVIELDRMVEFDRWLDLRGNGSAATVIRPSADFVEGDYLGELSQNDRLGGTVRVSGVHFDGQQRASIALHVITEERDIIFEDLTVSDAAMVGISVVSDSAESLVMRDSTVSGNGHTMNGFGMDVSGRSPGLSVVVENSEFLRNNVGLSSGLWYGADSDATFEVRGSRFLNNGSPSLANGAGALVLPYLTGAAADGSPRATISDTLFSQNGGRYAGAVLVQTPYLEKDPGTAGTSVLVTESTFSANRAATDGSGQGGTDVAYDGPTLSAESIAAPVLRVQNSTLVNDGSTPNVVLGWGLDRMEFEHVTLRGGGLFVNELTQPISVDLSNSVLDTGGTEAVRFERAGGEAAMLTLTNRASAFTTPGPIVPGEGSLVAASAALGLAALEPGRGTTPTVLLEPGSPLRGAALPHAGAPDLDQRGLPRPATGSEPDIGAVEMQLGVVRLVADVTVNEGDPAVFEAELVSAGDGATEIRVETADGTAKAGTDYAKTEATLRWGPGETGRKPVSVATIADDAVRGDRAFALRLLPSADAAIGSPGSVTGTIRDTSEAGVPPIQPPGTGDPKPPHGGQRPPVTHLATTGAADGGTGWLLLAAGAIGAGALLVARRPRRSRG